MCLVTWSCPILCDPMDCSPPGSPVHGDSPGKSTGVGCRALQGIFPTQGSNPGLPHYRQILYHLSHQGSPRILQWVFSPIPSPGDLSYPGIKPASPALQEEDGLGFVSVPPRWSWVRLWTSMCGPGQVTSCFFNLFPTHKMGRLIPCFCKIHHQFINFLYKRE